MDHVSSKLAALLSVSFLLAACASNPDAAESARVCPELNAAHSADKREFYGKSLLHRQYAEEYGAKAFEIGLAEQKAGIPAPNGSYGERIAYGALKACIPVHGDVKCRSIIAEYASYEDRAHKRHLEQMRYLCMSRGHDRGNY